MYFRTTTRKRGDKIYQSLHLVESYRTKEGKVRQRILVNFGSASQYSRDQIKEIIRGLQKFYQLEEEKPETIPPTASLDFGSTYAIFRLWEELGWTQVVQKFLKGRQIEFDVIANLKVMVANRLLDPMAKLHILDWLEGVHLPGLERNEIGYNHLLRSLDFLIAHKEELEPQLASLAAENSANRPRPRLGSGPQPSGKPAPSPRLSDQTAADPLLSTPAR